MAPRLRRLAQGLNSNYNATRCLGNLVTRPLQTDGFRHQNNKGICVRFISKVSHHPTPLVLAPLPSRSPVDVDHDSRPKGSTPTKMRVVSGTAKT